MSAIDTTTATLQNVTTRVPCNRQARTAIPSQTWQSLAFGLTLEQGKKMPNADQSKPAGKSGRRKGKGERGKKAVSQEGPAGEPRPGSTANPGSESTTAAAAGSRREPEDGGAAGLTSRLLLSLRRPNRADAPAVEPSRRQQNRSRP